jgi:hypothetical protein
VKRKAPYPAVADLADRALRAGIDIRDVVKLAGVDPSVWWRWVRGAGYHPKTLQKIEQQLTAMIERTESDG